eukprot:TRINITY_DN62870_c0_g1_i1.p1 TRINITY_DN62870_c0_g1~~TRINITY_DN62870_c0_g1_i1.p1  ORF type:complete len:560 (-),score=65.35 TRINITY_DN62870_c0_g1_i1:14-1447(-)
MLAGLVAARVRNIEQRRLRQLHIGVLNLTMVSTPVTLYNVLTEKDRWMSIEQDIIVAAFFFISVVWNVWPRLRQGRGMSVWYLLATMFSLAWIWFCSTLESLGFSFVYSTFLQLFSYPCGQTLTVMIWSVAHVTLCMNSDLVSLVSAPAVVLFCDLVIVTFICLNTYRGHDYIVASVRREIEVTVTRSGNCATTTLLTTVCDAVVELDEKLCIVDDSPRLAAMLLHGPGRSLKGENFSKYICNQEEESPFATRVCAQACVDQTNTTADVFHVSLQDSSNNIIHCEIFVVSFASYFEKIVHLVGIRENHGDGIISGVCKTSQHTHLRFDACSLRVVELSSRFGIGNSTNPCKVGSCLREWIVDCDDSEVCLQELRMAASSVRYSMVPFSFTSALVLRDVSQPGKALVEGACCTLECSMCVELEEGKTRSSDGARVIVTMKIKRILRRRPPRSNLFALEQNHGFQKEFAFPVGRTLCSL